MFDRLEDLGRRLEEILNQLGEPGVANDQNLYRKLMKEQAELAPIVEKYNEYKAAKEGIEDSLAILDEETDEETETEEMPKNRRTLLRNIFTSSM